MSIVRPCLVLLITTATPARAMFVAKSCGFLLGEISTPVARRWRSSLSYDQRVKLLQAERWTTIGEDVWYAVRHPMTAPTIWRKRRVSSKLRRLYQLGLFGVFILGSAQSYVGERMIEQGEALMPLAADEFELVSGAFHVWARVGEHNYDYMGADLRRDAGGLVGDLEIKGTTRVRFKVSPKAVRRLREDLEHSLGRTGLAGIPFLIPNNCISNIMGMIAKNTGISAPAGINRSPSLTFAYLKWRRAKGDPRVVDIYYDGRTFGSRSKPHLVGIFETAASSWALSNGVIMSMLADPASAPVE